MPRCVRMMAHVETDLPRADLVTQINEKQLSSVLFLPKLLDAIPIRTEQIQERAKLMRRSRTATKSRTTTRRSFESLRANW